MSLHQLVYRHPSILPPRRQWLQIDQPDNMLCYLAGILSISAVIFAEPYSSYGNLGEVVFSHVLFRHGNRMPLEFYPNDPYKDSPQWDLGITQLTEVGKQQEYDLGRWLRQRYSSLLSDQYNSDDIYVFSTDTDRTLMSAQCAMAGLYQPGEGQGWNPAIAWQPVPIHTIPVKQDYLVGASATYPCPAYNTETNRVNSLPEVQALQNKFKVMYDYVSNHTGNEVQDSASALKIYDLLAIQEQYNMSLPEWARSVYPEPIKEAGLYSFVLPTWTTLLQRLKIGTLLKEMTEHFQAKRAGTLSPDRKLWVYSAHDATLAALLNTFKVFDIHYPPHASCVTLELRLIKEKYFITLFYRNSTVEEPLLLPIKTCSVVCPLDEFVTLVQPFLPDNWEEECQQTSTTIDMYIYSTIVGVSGIVGGIIFIIITICCLKKKSSRCYVTMPSTLIGTTSKNSNY